MLLSAAGWMCSDDVRTITVSAAAGRNALTVPEMRSAAAGGADSSEACTWIVHRLYGGVK